MVATAEAPRAITITEANGWTRFGEHFGIWGYYRPLLPDDRWTAHGQRADEAGNCWSTSRAELIEAANLRAHVEDAIGTLASTGKWSVTSEYDWDGSGMALWTLQARDRTSCERIDLGFSGLDEPYVSICPGVTLETLQTIAMAHPLFAAMLPWVPAPPVPHKAAVARWGQGMRPEEV